MGTLTTSITLRTFPEEVEEGRWRDHIRFLFGADADIVNARADELSLSTTMERSQAREQAEREMRDEYTERLRSLAEPSEGL